MVLFVPEDNNADQATVVHLSPYASGRLRLKAPPDAEYTPGEWIPYDSTLHLDWSPALTFTGPTGLRSWTLSSQLLTSGNSYRLEGYDSSDNYMSNAYYTSYASLGSVFLHIDFYTTDPVSYYLLRNSSTGQNLVKFYADGTYEVLAPLNSSPIDDSSCSVYTYATGTDLDTVGTSDWGQDEGYAAAWMESSYDAGSDQQYYEIGLSSFSPSAFAGGIDSLQLPNRIGPEVQAGSGAMVWHINGTWNFEAKDETDPAVTQLDDCVLKFALVPSSLVELNGDNDPFEYQWKAWPTSAVLAGLTVIDTYTVPLSDVTSWTPSPPYYSTAAVQFTHEIDIDPTWVVDGAAHIAYWLERGDGSRVFNTQYSTVTSSDIPNSWGSVPDGPLNYAMYSYVDDLSAYGYYGYNEPVAGYWEKGSTDEIWLASKGTAAGSRWGYPGSFSNGYFSGDKSQHWIFSQVATNDFGVSVVGSSVYRGIVVTPTQIMYQNGTVSTTLDTHDVAFVTGDAVEVRHTGTLVEVLKSGTVVSSTDYSLLPDPMYYFYVNYWALDANTGNRIKGFHTTTPPTDRGTSGVYVELDNDPSSYVTGPPIVAYRYSYAVGYPKVFIENARGDTGGVHAVMWVKLEMDVSTMGLWLGWQSPEVVDQPTLPWSSYPNHDTPAGGYLIIRREDGKLLDLNDGVGSLSGVAVPWKFLDVGRGLIQMTGFTDGSDDYYNKPRSYVLAPGGYECYMQFDLDRVSDAPSYWTDDYWLDLVWYSVPRPLPAQPLMWTWQPGDDHNGYQDHGYAHVTAPVAKTLKQVHDGVALLMSNWTEGWTYGSRSEIFGYTEQDGLFYYTTSEPRGYHPTTYDDVDAVAYGPIATDDVGNMLIKTEFSLGQTGYHVAANDYTVSGDNQSGLGLASKQWALPQNEGRVVRGALEWPTDESSEISYYRKPTLNVWWTLWSKAYPDSFFTLVLAEYWPGDPVISGGYMYSWHQYEIDKTTGAVIREMAPFIDPTVDHSVYWRLAAAGQELTAVSGDGTQLRAVFDYNTGYEYTYDLSSETIVSSSASSLPGYRYLGTLEDGREIWLDKPWYNTGWKFHDLATGAFTDISFGDYEGRGYNGGVNGWDGKRYVWGGYLNNHTEPRYYILSAEEAAGTSYSAGDTVTVGGGIAQAFTEWVRWDLTKAGTVETPDLYHDYNGDLHYGYTAYWEYYTNGWYTSYGSGNLLVNGSVSDWSTQRYAYAFHDYLPTNGASSIRFEVQAAVYNAAATLSLQVDQYSWSGTHLQTNASNPDQNLLTAGGFNGTASLSVSIDPSTGYVTTTIIWKLIDVGDGTAIECTVDWLKAYGNNGDIPIEYMFNLDHEVPQGYCAKVAPEYGVIAGNRAPGNAWSAYNGAGIEMVLPYGGVGMPNGPVGSTYFSYVPNTDLPGWTVHTTPPAWTYTWVNGVYDYWQGFCKIRYTGPSVPGTIRMRRLAVDTAGNVVGSSSYDTKTIASLAATSGTWIDWPAYNFWTPNYTGAVGVVLEIGAIDITPGTYPPIDITHLNITPGYVNWNTDKDPAIGDVTTITGWQNIGDDAIEYRFPEASYPASFSPREGVIIGHSFSEGLRKPPSQRNPEHFAQRQHRAIQSMLPGSMAGRVANAELPRTASLVSSGSGGSAGSGPLELVASFANDLTTGQASAPMQVLVDSATAKSVYASLGDVGSTSTTVSVTKNGTTIATLTIPGGQAIASASISAALVRDDVIKFTITAAGADAGNLTVQLRS